MEGLNHLLGSKAIREKLRAIPGVDRIGFGLKEKDGQVLPEYVFRVYVREKKPLSIIDPLEVIPSEIDGIKTDVIVLQDKIEPLCGSRLTPGQQITRDIANYDGGWGTLGCIVKQGTTAYILTNQHVIVPENAAPLASEIDVYQPERSTCAEYSCNNPVATVVGEKDPWVFKGSKELESKSYHIDCGLLKINDKVTYSNTIDGLGIIKPQIRDLILEPVKPGDESKPLSTIGVHKRGAVTKVTHGVIVEFCHEETLNKDTSNESHIILWEIVIRPVSGYTYSKTYEIREDEPMHLDQIIGSFKGKNVVATRVKPEDPNDRRIHFEGLIFSTKGDSGSICVDDSQKTVGLLHAGKGVYLRVEGEKRDVFIPSGYGYASYIRPVLLALNLNLTDAIVVSTSLTAGPVMVQPGNALNTKAEMGGDLTESLNQFGSALQTTAGGQYLLNLFQEYHSEVLNLINRCRRVTVAWQRNKGPAFVAAFLNAIRLGEKQVPRCIADHSLENLIKQMFIALQQEGSVRLQQIIEQEREFIFALVSQCETFDHLFGFLKEEGQIQL